MRKNQVILIHGWPATGKYTIGKLLEKENGFLLDNHFFHDLFLHKVELSDENRDEYFGAVGHLKQQYIDILRKFYPKKSFVRYIFTSVMLKNESLLERLEKFASDIKADFIPIELIASEKVLEKRCQSKGRRQRHKISKPENMIKFLNKYKELLPDYTHKNKLTIDVSHLTIQKTFNLIQEHLSKFE